MMTFDALFFLFNKDGEPLESSPNILCIKRKAFTDVTGMEFQAMGELNTMLFRRIQECFRLQINVYHESAPYAKFNDFGTQCVASYIAQMGGQIKYGHSEVGNFTLMAIYEQNE